MDNSKVINQRVETVKRWLSNRYNLALVVVILLAIVIRIYYFIQTNGQALWWDEAEYMSTANRWALDVPYGLNPQRPPLFQFLAAIQIMMGLSEPFIKFTLVVVPSIILVYCVYLLGKEMYNEKIGLIASALTAVSWTLVFWGERFQPDYYSMVFSVLAVWFMWKSWKKTNYKFAALSGVMVALGFYFKVSALLVPMIFIPFIFFVDRFSAFKKKEYWFFAGAFILTLVPYFIWSYLTFGTPTAFTAGYVEPVAAGTPFGWYNFKFYYLLTEGLVFVLFLAGVILGLKFLLYADVLVKDKKSCFNADLFSILSLAVISAFYIFHIKNTDDRWVFLWLPFIFFLVGNSLMFIYSLVKKTNKNLALIAILILLGFGMYAQLSHAGALIDNKKESYAAVRDAGIWVRENSQPSDKLLSISYTQSVYYSERNVSSYSEIKNASDFDKYLQANGPRFMQVSAFEPHPPWVTDWLNANKDRLRVARAYFADTQQTQPVLIIYEIVYNKTLSA